jgi:dTDP-4-dehydrorhamnose reductase
MRILLTGTSGQVGAALAPRLARHGTLITPKRDAFDLSQPGTLAKALDAAAPDLIVNPAAYTAVDRAEDEPELANRVNAAAPASMAQWAARRGVPLIHVSTDYVFDGSGTAPWREDDAPNPLSVYGKTKLAGDEAVMAAGGPHLILRTSWVYAARGSNFLNTMIRLATEREELRVVADQIGAPTSAATIADVLDRILAQILDQPGGDVGGAMRARGGVLNVACAGETSWHGFATAIVEGLRARGAPVACRRIVPIGTQDYPTKARRPANSRLSLSRLQAEFGITPQAWPEALARETAPSAPA